MSNAVEHLIDEITESDEASAWDIELKKRVRDIQEKRVQGIPAEEVFAKLKEKFH